MMYITALSDNCAVMQMLKVSLGRKLKQWVQQERQVLKAAAGVTAAIVLLRLIGILQSSELAAFDQLFHLRLPEATDERIVIVEINEKDIQQAGQWPIPDRVIAQLLQKLNTYQPRTIGLNIYRDLPVIPGQAEFVNACETIPNLIGIEKLKDPTSLGVAPPPVLSQRKQVGFNNVVVDTDGKLRRSLLYWHEEGKSYQSLALKLALVYLKAEKITPKAAASNPKYLQLNQSVFRPFHANDGGYVGADTNGYQVLVNFRPPGSFRTVSMADVLADRVNPSWIRDRVVIIGSTAPSLQDFFYTPYSNDINRPPQSISGIELTANFVSQILSAALDGRPLIKSLLELAEWVWIFGWSWIGVSLSWRFLRLRSPKRLILVIFLAGISLISVCYLAFLAGWWLPLVPPVLALVGAVIVIPIASEKQLEKLQLRRTVELIMEVYREKPAAARIAIEYLKRSHSKQNQALIEQWQKEIAPQLTERY